MLYMTAATTMATAATDTAINVPASPLPRPLSAERIPRAIETLPPLVARTDRSRVVSRRGCACDPDVARHAENVIDTIKQIKATPRTERIRGNGTPRRRWARPRGRSQRGPIRTPTIRRQPHRPAQPPRSTRWVSRPQQFVDGASPPSPRQYRESVSMSRADRWAEIAARRRVAISAVSPRSRSAVTPGSSDR